MKLTDISWLAGILEGEGCFALGNEKYPLIKVQMSDEDVIVRVSNMWNVRVTRSRNMYCVQVNGAYAIQWMLTLYSFLGSRRKNKISDIVRYWRERSYVHASNGIHYRSTCHPDKPAFGYGLCNTCYSRERRGKLLLVGTK